MSQAQDTPGFNIVKMTHYSREHIDKMLLFLHEKGVSDVSMVPGEPPWVRLHGSWSRINETTISSHEIESFVVAMTNSASTAAKVVSGEAQDFPYEIQACRGTRIRFRVNATGCKYGDSVSIALVMRTIPSSPPDIKTMGIEDGILQAIQPLYGLVLITGPVGSGKTTLIASALRLILETSSRHVVTYEEPIEFNLVDIPNRKGLIVQTEIPKGLREFGLAPRNSLRRAGDVVLFGESRDAETLRNMSIVAETGVAVYTTVHTNSVAETISRMVREFPHYERDGMAAAMISSMRLIVHQRLIRAKTGRRIALREYLVFDEPVRNQLISLSYNELSKAIDDLVETQGQSLLSSAKKAYINGDINESEYQNLALIKEKEKRGLI